MLVLAVVAKALAVVRKENHDRAVVQSPLLQEPQEPSDDLVGAGDLSVVGERVPASEGLGRLVGRVRLEEVQEREERLVSPPADPLRQKRRRLVAAALDAGERLVDLRRLDGVLVELETARDARRVREHDRRDGAARRVALLREIGRQRRGGRAEGIPEVVPHAVLRRQQTREDRRMRRQRQGHVGVRVLVQDSVFSESVEVRRLDPPVPVRRKMVRPERVDRDQDDRRAGKNEAGVFPTRRREQPRERDDSREHPRRAGGSAGTPVCSQAAEKWMRVSCPALCIRRP